jgi:hypothetical protein
MPPHPRRASRRWRLAGKDSPPDRRPARIGELPDLRLQFLLNCRRRANRAPFALPEVGLAVLAQADDVDLGGLGPVLPHFEGGGDSFLAVEPGEGLAAEAFEAMAEVGVEVGADEVFEGGAGSHVAEIGGVGEDEAEPEAEEGIRQVVVDGADGGRLPRQRVAPLDGAELEELMEVVGEDAGVLAGLGGDLRDALSPR